MFIPYKIMVVYCYADEVFAGLWGHDNPQDTICSQIRTGFVVKVCNFPIL